MEAIAFEADKRAFKKAFKQWGDLLGIKVLCPGRTWAVTLGTALEDCHQILIWGPEKDWSVVIVRTGKRYHLIEDGKSLKAVYRTEQKFYKKEDKRLGLRR